MESPRFGYKAAVIAAAFSAALLSGCSSSDAEKEIFIPITGEIKVSYETAQAQYMTIEELEKIPAKLDYSIKNEFTAPYSSKVKSVNVKKFDSVKAGDVLLTLDTTDIDYRIKELQIQIASASDSVKKGYAQLELDKLTEQRNDAVVVAPYDGIIEAITYFEIGDDVEERQPLLTIADPYSVYLYNTDGDGKNLLFGMDVDLKINNIDYIGTVSAAPNTLPSTASGSAKKYCAVELQTEDKYRLMDENDGASAVDAGWATIFAVTVHRPNVLAVPESAVKADEDKTYCSVLKDDEKYDLPVEIGAYAGGFVEILSGINEGDTVILAEE